jgi:SSS family solute:Na+ symporter
MYLSALFIYFALLIIIGFFLFKKNINFETYFYGQRQLGSALVFFTVTASWFGAASTIATVQKGIQIGFQAIWLLGIPTIITLIIFILLNQKIRKLKFVSLPVFLNTFYGKTVAIISAFLIFIYMTVLAASQFVAWGKFVGQFIGEGYQITILIGALIVIIYSYFGGYLSVVLTDGLQFFLLLAAVLYLAFFLKGSSPNFSSADFNLFSNLENNLLMTLSFVLAWIISPIIWQRIASARSSKFSRSGLILSAISILFLYIMIIYIAIQLRRFPGADFATIIKQFVPLSGHTIVFIGIAAAIMSTADSAINIAALTLVKDVFKIKSPKRVMLYSKGSTLISGLFAVLIAFKFKSIILTLGLASMIMAAGLFVPGMYAIFFKKRKPLAGLFSLTMGGIYAMLVFFNTYGLGLPIPPWPSALPLGMGLAIFSFGLGYLLDNRRNK